MNQPTQKDRANCTIEGVGSSDQGVGKPLPERVTPGDHLEVAASMTSKRHTTCNTKASWQQKSNLFDLQPYLNKMKCRPAPEKKSTFIEKVRSILDDAKSENFEHVIKWDPDGLTFKIHNIPSFEQHILPRYLQQTKLRSFQRQ